ncbi:TNNI3K [Scenedesmus sp. PABB004]|nr:TNNI3K [Scenedesmus sp. PABB004]
MERHPWWAELDASARLPTWDGRPVGVKADGGGSVRGQGKIGAMALHRAAHNRRLEELVRLVDQGADVNEVEAAGNTPLHSAAFEGWREGAELLLQLGAKVNASNNAGDTPWHWAVNMGHADVAALLEANGASREKGAVLVPEHVPKVKDFFAKECWSHHPLPYADFVAFKKKERAELEEERKKLVKTRVHRQRQGRAAQGRPRSAHGPAGERAMRVSSSTRGAGASSRAAGGAAALLVGLALLACAARPAAGHAVMISPKSRPWYDYLLHYNYNPHAVFAGGVAKVSDGGKLQWPARKVSGICGDAYGEDKWDKPGPLGGTYKAGSTIKTDIIFAQNHLGRVHMRLCPLSAKTEAECVSLQRADGKGSVFDLPWTKGWWGVTDGFTPPVDTAGLPFDMYKMPLVGKAEGCAAWSCDQFRGMFVYSFAWALPKGYTCEACKLQMFYLTASRCWPPCVGGGPCTKPVDYAFCGTPGATYPEE